MLHTNFTPDGVKTPAFPGAEVADKIAEPGARMGLRPDPMVGGRALHASVQQRQEQRLGDSTAPRCGFSSPCLMADDRTFFYGSNFEFSFNAKRWEARRFTSEIRPIHRVAPEAGGHHHQPDSRHGLRRPQEPRFWRRRRASPTICPVLGPRPSKSTMISDPLRRFNPLGDQAHTLYGVVDYTGKAWELEAGVGMGLTRSSDRVVLKLIASRGISTSNGRTLNGRRTMKSIRIRYCKV